MYEVTVANKAQKKFWGSNGIGTHDLCNTSAMLYQLSYEASLEAGMKLLHNCEDHFNWYSLSAMHSYGLYHVNYMYVFTQS